MKLVRYESQDFVLPVSSWMGSRMPAVVEARPTCLQVRVEIPQRIRVVVETR